MLKKNVKMWVLYPASLLCMALGFSAHAQTAVVTITGKVKGMSCTPSVNGGSNAITLPEVQPSAFPNVTNTTGTTKFTVNATACGTGRAPIKAYFYSNNVTDGRLNIISGGGTGWQYQLLTDSNHVINITNETTPSDNANDPGGNVSGGTASMTYKVRYYRSATNITQGIGNTNVNLAFFYP